MPRREWSVPQRRFLVEKKSRQCLDQEGGRGQFFSRCNFENNDSLSNNVKCQDGARIHTSNASLDFLQEVFGDRIMTGRQRGQMMDWPAASPDLSPADFWLHGYLKVSSNF